MSTARRSSTRVSGGGSTPTSRSTTASASSSSRRRARRCSVQFGTRITSAAPGSAQGLYLVVSDIEAARDELVGHGVEVSEVFHRRHAGALQPLRRTAGRQRPATRARELRLVRHVQRPRRQRVAAAGGHHPAARPHRHRETAFASAADLASAMRRASAAHGEHEKRSGEADPNWPDWYAAYMVAEQAGDGAADMSTDNETHKERT